MAHKQVLFRSAAREKIPRGATQLADAVRITLGPKPKSVLIEKKWGPPLVCNDGATITRTSARGCCGRRRRRRARWSGMAPAPQTPRANLRKIKSHEVWSRQDALAPNAVA
jgi:hypothetical protein